MAAAASGDFDFSAYDANRDGILQERELVIVVAAPQSTNGGSQFDTNLRPYCDGSLPVMLNGVEMQGFISWYTGNGANLSDAVTLAHEEGHFPGGLDDMYTLNNTFTPATADHDPDKISIMSSTSSSAWQHLDGFQKLALGWVTPRIVRESGTYELEDVKTGGQVLILPREGSLGREYFLIENRQATAAGDDLYDNTIGDSGAGDLSRHRAHLRGRLRVPVGLAERARLPAHVAGTVLLPAAHIPVQRCERQLHPTRAAPDPPWSPGAEQRLRRALGCRRGADHRCSARLPAQHEPDGQPGLE
jgi:M6 family metalloprotease-like protein